MTEIAPRTLDVRPILAAGGEPFGDIMAAVAGLEHGQALRLIAPFKPVPLFTVMEKKGYKHTEKLLAGSDWEVLFEPGTSSGGKAGTKPAPAANTSDTFAGWPAPAHTLDNRGLQPPEPMVRILETLESMKAGEVLEAINERDPVFLYPELAKRGHAIRVEPRNGGGFRVVVRHSAAGAAS